MRKSIPLLAILLNTFTLMSQISNFVYFLSDSAQGNRRFAKIDLTTKAVTTFQTVYKPSNLGAVGSCIDENNMIFYYSTGSQLTGFSAVTETIVVDVNISIPGGGEFWYPAFNPCDSTIYGIVRNQNSGAFAKLNPVTGQVNIIASLGNMLFAVGKVSAINPMTNTYIVDANGNNLYGININTGQMLFSPYMIAPMGGKFGHVSFNYSTNQIFGLNGYPSIIGGTKYLATIDPTTGNVTNVSDISWDEGISKPIYGGNCMDQTNGIYYYSGAPNLLLAINSTTGEVVFIENVDAQSVILVQYFSTANCTLTDVVEPHFEEFIDIFPNPTTELLHFSNTTDAVADVYDTNGKIVLRSKIQNFTLDVSLLTKGVYYLRLTKENSFRNLRFIKM